MYYKYFGLTEAPFSIAPNPEYLYMTERHQEALAHLHHGVESDAGFVVLTGEVGTGKTTVCRSFLDKIPKDTKVAFILNPFLSGKELLHMICQELSIKGVPDNASLRQLTNALYHQLLANHARGVQTVLLIDEAQHLHFKVLELIRLLTNLETDTQKLLKIILVGQPELNDTINKPELSQLSQRVTARYHIRPLGLKETASYIDYRLRMAGYLSEKKLFSVAIVKRIHSVTGGVPRLINVICDRALLGAYSYNQAMVDKTILLKAIAEVQGENNLKTRRTPIVVSAIAAGVMVLLVGAWFLKQPLSMILSPDSEVNIASIENPPLNDFVADGLQSSASSVRSAPVEPETQSQSSALLPADSETLQQASIQTSLKNAPQNYYSDLNAAAIDLISLIKNDLPLTTLSCDELNAIGWQCRRVVASNWDVIKKYNRPAIITLRGALGSDQYIAITGVSTNTAQILGPDGVAIVALEELQRQWSGEFVYLWQPPEGFVDYIYFDSDKILVDWLASAFSIVDNKDQLLATERFNVLLKQRVILFQRENELDEDGIAGVETLLKLNERLGLAITLNQQLNNASLN